MARFITLLSQLRQVGQILDTVQFYKNVAETVVGIAPQSVQEKLKAAFCDFDTAVQKLRQCLDTFTDPRPPSKGEADITDSSVQQVLKILVHACVALINSCNKVLEICKQEELDVTGIDWSSFAVTIMIMVVYIIGIIVSPTAMLSATSKLKLLELLMKSIRGMQKSLEETPAMKKVKEMYDLLGEFVRQNALQVPSFAQATLDRLFVMASTVYQLVKPVTRRDDLKSKL